MKRFVMDKRFKRIYLIMFIFPGLLFSVSCSYLVKNDQHRIYSKPQYGIDRFVIVQGYNIHYVESGEGEPMLLIPGAFSTYRDWDRMIPSLSKHYKLLAIDYLGVGDSDKPRSGFGYTIEDQADLIAKMLETLKISKVSIVGVSYGGGIALNLAARYKDKVREVICIEGNGVIKHKKAPFRSLAVLKLPVIGDIPIGMIRSGLIDWIIAKWVIGKAWHPMSHQEKEEITGILSQNNKSASRISWYHISRTMETSKDFSEEAKTIRVPVLYLYGKKSEYRGMVEMNIEFFKTHLPHVELVGIEDGIHDLQLQKPKEVAHLILEFLDKNRGREQKVVSQ